jgi:hypothetical protein
MCFRRDTTPAVGRGTPSTGTPSSRSPGEPRTSSVAPRAPAERVEPMRRDAIVEPHHCGGTSATHSGEPRRSAPPLTVGSIGSHLISAIGRPTRRRWLRTGQGRSSDEVTRRAHPPDLRLTYRTPAPGPPRRPGRVRRAAVRVARRLRLLHGTGGLRLTRRPPVTGRPRHGHTWKTQLTPAVTGRYV